MPEDQSTPNAPQPDAAAPAPEPASTPLLVPITPPAPTPAAIPSPSPTPEPKKGYDKRPLWVWIVLYIIVATVLYTAAFLLFHAAHSAGTASSLYNY